MGFEENVPPDRRKMTRRNFTKGIVIAAAGGAAGATGVASLLSSIGEQPETVGEVNPRFIYFLSEDDRSRNVWYSALDGQTAFTQDFEIEPGETGRGANVLWRQITAEDEETGDEKIVYRGMPAIVLKLNPDYAPEEFYDTEGVVQYEDGLFTAFSGKCVHLCCVPGWHKGDPWDLLQVVPEGDIRKYPWIFCPCHGSRWDPTDIIDDQSPDSGGNYRGARRIAGPAPRSQPQIPLEINNDGEIIGLEYNLQWYNYC